MKVKDKLNQGNWCKGSWGKDKEGKSVGADSPNMCKMCLKTACFKAEGIFSVKSFAIRMAIKDLFPSRLPTDYPRFIDEITHFNDHKDTTWEDIEQVLELADV